MYRTLDDLIENTHTDGLQSIKLIRTGQYMQDVPKGEFCWAVDLIYDDGSVGTYYQENGYWRRDIPHYVDAATQTGMYDR